MGERTKGVAARSDIPQATADNRRTHNDDEALDRETKLRLAQMTLASARDVIGTAGEDERRASAVLLILMVNGAEHETHRHRKSKRSTATPAGELVISGDDGGAEAELAAIVA